MTDLAPLRDRLRTTLRTLGIAATDDDVAGMDEKGFLARVALFEAAVAGVPTDTLPDVYGMREDGSPTTDTTTSAADAARTAADGDTPIAFWSVGKVAEAIRRGEVSPVEVTEAVLARIEADDRRLNVFQQVFAEQARADARRATEELARGVVRGPLHGVPVAVKDLVAVAGVVQSAGSQILADAVAPTDATATSRLRESGAILIGKTRMSEFAYSPGSNNAHYGPTRNPWNPNHDSGGSSSGSTVAVATGMAYAALGSDTGGSIRIPAALCGIVGLKPTFGRCSLAGVTPLSWSLDHMGPLTRTVGDAALLLSVLSGDDGRDGRTQQVPRWAGQAAGSVHGLRVGVVTGDGSAAMASDRMLAGWQGANAALAEQGATLLPIDMPELDTLRLLSSAILAAEAAAFHLPWLRTRLDDYGPFMRQRILSSFAYAPDAYLRAQQARTLLRRRLNGLFERVDVLSLPCQPDTAPLLGTPAPTTLTNPFNALGWPAISVPCGQIDGLPIGCQLVGRPWDETTVLRAAQAIEQMFTPVFNI